MKKKELPFDAGDILVFASLAFIFIGLYMIQPAFAYLAVGVILLCFGIVIIRAKASQRGDDG